MQYIHHLFYSSVYIDLPNHFSGWAGIFLLSAIIILGLWQWIKIVQLTKKAQTFLFLAFLLIVPFTSLMFGIQLNQAGNLIGWSAVPGLPVSTVPVVIMVLSSIPWVICAIFLPSYLSVILAAESAVFLAFFHTHSLYTIFIIPIVAIIFSVSYNQKYRTSFFHLLRHPAVITILCGLIILPLTIICVIFETDGYFINRLDYAISHAWLYGVAFWLEVILGGIAGEIISLIKNRILGSDTSSENPSPFEAGIESKAIVAYIPFLIAIIFGFFFINWFIASRYVRNLAGRYLGDTASVFEESLPYYFEFGQSIIRQIAQSDNISGEDPLDDMDIARLLENDMFFSQMMMFGQDGMIITSYSVDGVECPSPTPDENAGILYALAGVTGQFYMTEGVSQNGYYSTSFITGIMNDENQVAGVLLGRADINNNPIIQPVVNVVRNLEDRGGSWKVIDQNGHVILHSGDFSSKKDYSGYMVEDGLIMEELSPQGNRTYTNITGINGKQWTLIVSLPFMAFQSEILHIVIVNTLLITFAGLIGLLLLHNNYRQMSNSLLKLTQEVRKITRDQFHRPVKVEGVDEVGKLGVSIEKMRVSIKSRQEELTRVMTVRKSVPSSLDVINAMQQILSACLMDDAIVARVILDSTVLIDRISEKVVAYAAGEYADNFQHLDEQIYQLMRTREVLVVPDTNLERDIPLSREEDLPAAMVIAPLFYESHYLGALWIGFEAPRVFTDEWMKLIELIISETSMVVANIRLYTSAEVDRHRFEAALSSLPEPVLIFDELQRLILVNPAALQVKGLIIDSMAGSPIKDVVAHEELSNLLISNLADHEIRHIEITLSEERTFQASISQVVNDNQTVAGIICILKEISHYKALDEIKSDFVATVSHDLRSPLAQVSGYVTMLQMVGELNEQQNEYAEKINTGIQEMTHLISNLLDLGRIEAGVGLKIEKVEVTPLIEQIVKTFQPNITQKKLSVKLSASNEAMLFDGDKALISQALVNLVDNAIKYTPVEGTIHIDSIKNNDKIRFEVHDTGIGIAPIDLPHIFDKFYLAGRRDSQSRRGVGLGLSIVKTIAERHHGKVWAESQLGKGSNFYLEIPIKFREQIDKC